MRFGPLLLLAVAAGCGGGGEPPASREGRHDGLWLAVSIDGKSVAPERFILRIRGGKVVGGRDGCNSWVFDQMRPPEPNGTRTILSDLMGCGHSLHRRGYWAAIGNGNAIPTLSDGSRLRVKAGGHEIVAGKLPD